MRKYILIALVLLVGGFAVSTVLVPGVREFAGGSLGESPMIDLSKVNVEAEYAAGRRSLPIVSALADIRAAAGDRPAAVKLLEEYVTANPTDLAGRKKLAEHYQAVGNMKAFGEQLEALAQAAPTEANLRLLSDLYNSNKDYVKQQTVLEKILEVTNGEKPEAFVDLATIQMVNGDTQGTLKTIDALHTKHTGYNSFALTRLEVNARADAGDHERAFAVAKTWLETPAILPAASPEAAAIPAPTGSAALGEGNPRPKELADLCDILHYAGYAPQAVALVELHKEWLNNEPAVALAYVKASITAGKTEQAYALLKQMEEAGTLTDALYPPYLMLTLKREDVPAAETIANKIDLAHFSEMNALDTLEVVRSAQAPSVLAILTQRFSAAEYSKDKPVLVAVLGLLNKDNDLEAKLDTALNASLTAEQRLRLGEACARATHERCLNTILAGYPALESQSPGQVAEFAQLHILAGRAATLVDPVGKLTDAAHPTSQVQRAHRRLAAAAGREDLLKPWLEASAATTPIAQLQDLFYLANDNKHSALAGDIAERLYARDPSPMNRELVVAAYLGAGAYGKALPLLREQVSDGSTSDALYLSTLNKLASKDAAARKELTEYAYGALGSGKGDTRARLNYAYILINHGRKDVVLPIAKAEAESQGGEWKKLYTQLTFVPKPGAPWKAIKLSREQMVAMANNRSISATNRRQIAFNLLHDGHKDDATVIFKSLAEGKSPDSQEVKDLLYLWGGKLNHEQLSWIETRAAKSSTYDQTRWGEIVRNAADDEQLLRYVSNTPEALYNRALRQHYFRVLGTRGGKSNFDTAMQGWVEGTSDVPALMDYAKSAQDFGYRDAAIRGYSRVLALDPSNRKALAQKAALDFSKGKFSTADRGITQYLANPEPEAAGETAEAHFYKAQLLRRGGQKDAAMREFEQVLALSAQAGVRTSDALSRLYTAQFHLGRHDEAKANFENLLQQFPEDKGVLADYMSVLIEYKYLEDATRIANQYDKNSPYYRKGAVLTGRSAYTAGVERKSGGREVKIQFSRATEDHAPIRSEDMKNLAWLERSEVGYDSLTVSAKPGYVIYYVPTAQESFALVAQPTPTPEQIEAQREQDLRLQLLYARIEQDSGQTDHARARLNALKQYYPNNPQILSYEAALESASGNPQQALALVQEAQRVAPENEDLTLQAQNIGRIEASGASNYVKLDHAFRALGDNNEQITTLAGVVHQGRAEFGVTAQNNFLQTDNTRRASDGRIGDYDTTRQRGELYAAYNLPDGSRAQASLFANNDTPGGGLYYDFDNPLGRTGLIGEYKRPYWDFVEAVYEDATRDRVGFKHFATLRPGTTLGVEASYNNYSTEEADDVAQSTLVRVNAIQQLQAQTETRPYLGIGYGFDGEYLNSSTEKRVDGSGNVYSILPVRTREVHALTGIYRNEWWHDTHALFIGGVAYDRIGDSFSPLVEGRVDHDLNDRWQIGARARYAQETNNTDNRQLDVGADVIYKF